MNDGDKFFSEQAEDVRGEQRRPVPETPRTNSGALRALTV